MMFVSSMHSAVVFEKPLKHVQHVLTMCDSRASLTVPQGKKSIFAFNGITLVECEIRSPLRLVFLGDVAVPCRKPVESAPRSGAARWTRPAVLLNARGTQTGKPCVSNTRCQERNSSSVS